jgi:hypothetical protein
MDTDGSGLSLTFRQKWQDLCSWVPSSRLRLAPE